jgi:hypothetical protein
MAPKTPAPKTGRASIFRNKEGGGRVQGVLTKQGVALFEYHRKRLATLAKREASHVSDADVIEYLARGRQETADILAGKKAS